MRALAVFAILTAATAAHADGSGAQWRTDDQPHAGMPFELDLIVEGLDESPQPDQPKLAIAGATVRPLGVSPNVSQSIQIVNGRYSKSTRVTWVFRWQVTVAKPGTLDVPQTTVVQGSHRATAQGAQAEVRDIPKTDAMKLELSLPDRPVFVGENIPVTLTWLFRAEPQKNPTFQVPMLDGESFTIGTVPQTNQKTYKFQGGDKTLDLPFTLDDTNIGGTQYHRLRATFYAAPKKTGKIEVAPASVVVALGVGDDGFFTRSQLFSAADVAHTLEVKPLPETDRPAGFAGAVGTQFSVAVTTSRSVVQLGEPVELAITVKSDQRLDTLSLPHLDGPGMLPKDKFAVPAETPTGELSDDGKTKTFKVTAQVTGPANEVPSLAFSYFDPVKSQYQTVHSDPIALSVKGGAVVGAGDVVSAAPAPKTATALPGDGEFALVGAELSLSSAMAAEDRPWSGWILWLLVGLLYAAPLALLGVRTWQLRTRGQREEAAEVRAARKRVEAELARAAKDPARDTAGALATSLRNLARTLERDVDDGGLLARLETESFAPSAGSVPVSAELRAEVEQLVARWMREAKTRRTSGGRGKAAGVAAILVLALAPSVHADNYTQATAYPASVSVLEGVRESYQAALAEPNAAKKRAELQVVAQQLAEAARAAPDRPELLADWGTAALAAGDVATATLAFRRALAIDGGNARARKNLAWLRGKQPEELRPHAESAADTLFFFHAWPRSRRWIVGAAAFALAILLIVPWTQRRRRLAGLALVPAAVWLAMTISLVVEDRHTDDAVVTRSSMLRAADSAGAPAAMAQPLPRGTEVTIVEHRDTWTRVRVASGTAGWVESGALERVTP